MFAVILRFSENRDQAAEFMDVHKAWIKRGFDDGVFLLSGSIQPSSGGVVFAHNSSSSDLQSRVNDDPFVSNGVVTAEILKITPGLTDERLKFLLDDINPAP